jgi:hypothetical protein
MSGTATGSNTWANAEVGAPTAGPTGRAAPAVSSTGTSRVKKSADCPGPVAARILPSPVDLAGRSRKPGSAGAGGGAAICIGVGAARCCRVTASAGRSDSCLMLTKPAEASAGCSKLSAARCSSCRRRLPAAVLLPEASWGPGSSGTSNSAGAAGALVASAAAGACCAWCRRQSSRLKGLHALLAGGISSGSS